MAGIILRKLKGATLMEVLVAIAIIMSVFTISTIVFLNVTGSSYTGDKLKASLLLNEISMETNKSKTFLDEEISKDDIVIKKTFDKYNNHPNLMILTITAFNSSQKLLSERKEIILIEDE
jgi:hypothetical protein